MKKSETKFKISKDDFISFLSHATPEEVNDYIMKKGKPPKLVDLIVFFDSRNSKK